MPEETDPTPPAPAGQEQPLRLLPKGPQGVGGWLLLFCLGLIVFFPLFTLNNLVSSHRTALSLASRYPGLLVVTLVDGALSLAMVAFSIYAGVSLWRIRPGAVRTAEIYLLCYLCYQGIAAVLPYLAGLPSLANRTMSAETAMQAVRALGYVGIWTLYLRKSERVRATYGPPTLKPR